MNLYGGERICHSTQNMIDALKSSNDTNPLVVFVHKHSTHPIS